MVLLLLTAAYDCSEAGGARGVMLTACGINGTVNRAQLRLVADTFLEVAMACVDVWRRLQSCWATQMWCKLDHASHCWGRARLRASWNGEIHDITQLECRTRS